VGSPTGKDERNDDDEDERQEGDLAERILAAVAAGNTTLQQLDKAVRGPSGPNPANLRWYLCRMTADGKLRRVSPGVYALPAKAKTAKNPRAAK
jgi:hypothetical protein